MAAKKARGIGLVKRTNVVRAINVGSPGSVRTASATQNAEIRQRDGRSVDKKS